MRSLLVTALSSGMKKSLSLTSPPRDSTTSPSSATYEKGPPSTGTARIVRVRHNMETEIHIPSESLSHTYQMGSRNLTAIKL